MEGVVNSIFRFLLPSEISSKTEKIFKKYRAAAWFVECRSNYF
jgi:hypothetical protein